MAARPPSRAALPVVLAAGAALAAPAPALGAPPAIAPVGGDDTWNAAEGAPTYTITGDASASALSWWLEDGEGGLVRRPVTVRGNEVTVVLDDLPQDGPYRVVARLARPFERATAERPFTLDTAPPAVTIRSPRAGAVYAQGQRVVADYACAGATRCEGTVPAGAPIGTSTPGAAAFAVIAADAAGNRVTGRVSYRVLAPPTPAVAGAPPAPSPPIRLAPAPGEPEPTPETRNAGALRPAAGATVTDRRPLLRWPAVRGATLYNLQLYRLAGGRAVKIASRFPRGNRARPPEGALRFGQRYAWRVWPLVGGRYPSQPIGQSWFRVRRPVRLTPAQLLVNQRIAQAALRRTAAISAWLDAGLVAGDLRDGGLGPREFGPGVRLAGTGSAIDNGLATPRPLTLPPSPRRAATAPRLRVSGRQMLVNQRISQAAVRRANALARRLEGGLTGGDLRPGAVTPNKVAPGWRVTSARAAVPRPAASRTAPAPAGRRSGARVRATDRQALVNQRISQAAVRRANALAVTVEGGLTGAAFRDGSITAHALAPALRR